MGRLLIHGARLFEGPNVSFSGDAIHNAGLRLAVDVQPDLATAVPWSRSLKEDRYRPKHIQVCARLDGDRGGTRGGGLDRRWGWEECPPLLTAGFLSASRDRRVNGGRCEL